MSRNMKICQAYLEIDDDASMLKPRSEPWDKGSTPADSIDRSITRTTHIHMRSSAAVVDKELVQWK